jgi:hemoglobin-like flavoprotein
MIERHGHTLLLTVLVVYSRIFDIAPSARSVFSFGKDEDLLTNPEFPRHARTFVDMMDCAVGFLGPDLDPFVEDLQDLGGRHLAFGVRPEYFKVVGQAFFHALQKFLGISFDARNQESFQTVFKFICSQMEVGYNKKKG